MIEIISVGGYEEVGKNMTVIKYKNEAVVLDMGVHLPSLIKYQSGGGNKKYLTKKGMQKIGIIPDDSKLDKKIIKAIVPSHCHLDHTGGIMYMEEEYDCPIYGTPYTLEFLKILAKDEDIDLKNKLIVKKQGSRFKVSENIEIELVNMTHSTLDAAMIVVHTPDGMVVYSNDFKLDNKPVMGKKPDTDRLKEIGKTGKVRALILDSLYSGTPGKSFSESVAKEMLKDVMLGTENTGHGLIVTSFASQIARLKSAVEFGRKIKRKVVFLGRSLAKYTQAADNLGYVPWMKEVEVVTYGWQVKKKLKEIEKNREKYLVVCTGNQAEENAILTRIGDKKLPFKFQKDDHVVFSCRTIPVEPNITNRAKLEKQLIREGVRVFKDIHASGHGAIEDSRDLIEMLNPEKIIPGHGSRKQTGDVTKLTNGMGYKTGKDVIFMEDVKTLRLK
ncbi:MBL fold metallo-hydrolase [Candidatus Woesearchaeota archaeon]|jgi:ribonuclease J|nr:MBL fold metallo-hydrolase [Candidatus Woesearchaeota archaeon]